MAHNLKQQLFSGVFWTALAKYSGIFISLIVAGVLARLLSPEDFGIVAIANHCLLQPFHRCRHLPCHYTK